MVETINIVLSLIDDKVIQVNQDIREMILDPNRGDIHGCIEYLTNLKIAYNVLQGISEQIVSDNFQTSLEDIDNLVSKL